jgi:hypothetical protein
MWLTLSLPRKFKRKFLNPMGLICLILTRRKIQIQIELHPSRKF